MPVCLPCLGLASADARWTTTRVGTHNAPFGMGAITIPRLAPATGPCTANASAGERLLEAWNKLWDEATLYKALPKTTRDELWGAYQAFNQWFDDGFVSGGVWCRRKEDLDAWTATLERAKGALAAEIAARNLVRTEPTGPTKPTKRVELPETEIGGVAPWWALTLGVVGIGATLIAIRAAQRRRGLGLLPEVDALGEDRMARTIRAVRRRYRPGKTSDAELLRMSRDELRRQGFGSAGVRKFRARFARLG